MKITMTLKEANNLKKIMNSAEENSVKELKEALNDTNLISYNVDVIKNQVTITVDDKYMVDYLDVCCKYIDVFVSQVRTLYGTACMFQADVETVLKKYDNISLD